MVLTWLRNQAEIFDQRVCDLAKVISGYADLKHFGPNDSKRLGNHEHEQQYAKGMAALHHEAIGLIELQTCEWKKDDDGIFQTGCGHSFYFDDGGSAPEHGLKFCGYCGAKLAEVRS